MHFAHFKFLSSLAQDFIEEPCVRDVRFPASPFLSSLAQDFIEESTRIREHLRVD